MKGLLTLIKLRRRELDQLRRQMGVLQEERARHIARSLALTEQLKKEIESAANQPEMAMFFGNFSDHIAAQQDEIREEVHRVDRRIIQLTAKITEAFGDLKKFEITRDNIKAREAEEARRKEQILLDEIAAQQHHMNKNKELSSSGGEEVNNN